MTTLTSLLCKQNQPAVGSCRARINGKLPLSGVVNIHAGAEDFLKSYRESMTQKNNSAILEIGSYWQRARTRRSAKSDDRTSRHRRSERVCCRGVPGEIVGADDRAISKRRQLELARSSTPGDESVQADACRLRARLSNSRRCGAHRVQRQDETE